MESKHIPAVCPAIQKDDERRTNYPGEPERTIESIVRGDIPKMERKGPDENAFEMRVDEVLYGSWPAKTIRFSWPWACDGVHQIVALVSDPYGDPVPWLYKYALDATPEALRVARALAEARLAYNVFSAKYIFLGQDVELVQDQGTFDLTGYLRRIKVLNVISGEGLAKDKEITGLVDGFVRRSEGSPLLSKKPHLYLIGDVADDKEKGGLRYVVATMMGAAPNRPCGECWPSRTSTPSAGSRSKASPSSTGKTGRKR